MIREEQLKYCKVCENKSFHRDKGIICGLTNNIADFEGDCPNFVGDFNKIHANDLPDKSVKHPDNRLLQFFSAFLPNQNFIVTPIIILLCVLYFIIMALSGVDLIQPDPDALVNWGANFRPLTFEGEYWRLFTNFFMHIGIAHLLINMAVLLFMGSLIEPLVGRMRFLVIYIISGLGGSVASMYWHSFLISAGSSSAIFGLYGVYIAFLTTGLLGKEKQQKTLGSFILFVVYSLVYGLNEGIDNAAHIGGLLCGLAIGFSLFPLIVNPNFKPRNLLIHFSTITSIIVVSTILVVTTPNPMGKYNKIMTEFIELEENALSFFRLPLYSSDDRYLRALKTEGIPNWQKCRELLNEIDSIDNIPVEFIETVELLKSYCDLRIKSYYLMAKSIESNSRIYDHEIGVYNHKIDIILHMMHGTDITDEMKNAEPIEFTPSLYPDGMLYVVNGILFDNIDNIDPKKILSIQILDSQVGISTYGERANNGVIIIEMEYEN